MVYLYDNSDILRQDGVCADAIYVRGLCLYYQDNIDKAFQHFKQVLVYAPDHSKARDVHRVCATV
jgi:DnaJ homolog subfamily C member 7